MLGIIVLFHNAGYTFGINDRLCDQLKHAKTRYESHNVLINFYCTNKCSCNVMKSQLQEEHGFQLLPSVQIAYEYLGVGRAGCVRVDGIIIMRGGVGSTLNIAYPSYKQAGQSTIHKLLILPSSIIILCFIICYSHI